MRRPTKRGRAAAEARLSPGPEERTESPSAATRNTPPAARRRQGLAKAPTGIDGFDEITGGGLPRGRPTLVCGGPGSGKTLFSIQFLVNGALGQGEPGVFVSFEERAEELAQNVASLGVDLEDLAARNLIRVDHVRVERSEIEETGDYDLEGLFVRMGHAIDSIGARRVVLDTIESLFSGLPNLSVLRAELRRLFAWLKGRGVTVVLTGERGEGQLTRQGLEEYVSDCVVFLDHRVKDQVSTRRLRVVKYRGSAHGTNEYPFLIQEDGISVLPITSMAQRQRIVSDERVPSGIPGLDEMLGGGGFHRGSSVLLSGTAGTGKTTIASIFAASVCRSRERCLYFAFEESPEEIIRNMRSIGLDLETPATQATLRFASARPVVLGLETHLSVMHKLIDEFKPAAIVVDPLTSLFSAGEAQDVEEMVLRLMDYVKSRGITGLYTSLTRGDSALETTELKTSSLMDSWLFVRDIEHAGERNRGLYILKSRGTAHSNQIREFVISSSGIELLPAQVGADGVLLGSARLERAERDRISELEHQAELERRAAELTRRRRTVEAQIVALQGEVDAEEAELEALKRREGERQARLSAHRATMERSRRSASSQRGTDDGRGARTSRQKAKGHGGET